MDSVSTVASRFSRKRDDSLPNRRCFLAAIWFVFLLMRGGDLTAAGPQDGQQTPISIAAEFPGGNIVVDDINGDTIRLHQDERDTPRFWFYWCFEVAGAQGRTLTFVFTKGNVFGTRGPAISLDGGTSWEWLGTDALDGDSFRYSFGSKSSKVRFAFSIPYTPEQLQIFLQRHASNSALRQEELTKTLKKSAVALLRAGRIDGHAPHRVLLTCRHHACESIANFVLEGVLESALDDTDTGRWFREQVEIVAVPFMDRDGVEAGDQGKLRTPHDHWLDYEGKSLYAETAALRVFCERESQSRPFGAAIDLHCPYIRDSKIYFALGSEPRIAESTSQFCRLFDQRQQGPLVYHSRDDSPFGTGWNVAATYDGRRSFWRWAQTLPDIQLVATLEVPYASVADVAVTPENARLAGHDLATALRAYFERSPQGSR